MLSRLSDPGKLTRRGPVVRGRRRASGPGKTAGRLGHDQAERRHPGDRF